MYSTLIIILLQQYVLFYLSSRGTSDTLGPNVVTLELSVLEHLLVNVPLLKYWCPRLFVGKDSLLQTKVALQFVSIIPRFNDQHASSIPFCAPLF